MKMEELMYFAVLTEVSWGNGNVCGQLLLCGIHYNNRNARHTKRLRMSSMVLEAPECLVAESRHNNNLQIHLQQCKFLCGCCMPASTDVAVTTIAYVEAVVFADMPRTTQYQVRTSHRGGISRHWDPWHKTH